MAGLRKGRFYASNCVTLSHYMVDAAEITIDIDPPFTWMTLLPGNADVPIFLGTGAGEAGAEGTCGRAVREGRRAL